MTQPGWKEVVNILVHIRARFIHTPTPGAPE